MNLLGPRADMPKPGKPACPQKRRGLLLAGIVFTIILAATIGRPAFSRWQHEGLIHAAEQAFASGDLRSACITARQALVKNPASTPAYVILAQIAEREQSPEAVLWRQRLVDLNPKQSPRLLELAACASNIGETFIAEQALAQVPEGDRNTLSFHATAGALAIAEKQLDRAEMEFRRAAALDPKDENLRLNLATIHLALSQPGEAVEAVATLEQLRRNPQFRHAALRALLTDARRRDDAVRAHSLADELRHGADASLGDILLWLEELKNAKSPEFDGELRTLQAAVAKNNGAIYAVIAWMNAHGLPSQSIEWCESLPPKTRAQIPIPLAEAEARTALGDWKRLRVLLNHSDWGDLEFLRFAMLAKVVHETTGHARRADFQTHWERATSSTIGNANALSMLARLVTGWGWKAEAAQVWWLIAAKPAGQRPALKALFQIYSEQKNARELYRVAKRVLQVEPANPIAKNNVASLALLLGEDEAEAHRLAAENYQRAPGQPVFVSTYAMSLHRQKRTAEAVAIFAKVPPAALEDPAIAACHGFLLAENGELEKARPFLEAADRQKEKLFPEEAAMIAGALRRSP